MDIEITSANNQFSSLGLNRTFQFLGDAYKYRIEKVLSLSGNLLDLANAFGVSGITSELEATLVAFLNDWHDIKVNGVSFGEGFMSSVEFSSGNDVRTKTYSASFTIYEDGDLGDLKDELGNHILNNSDLRYADAISESFSLDKNQKNKTYVHNVNITIPDYSGASSGITLAKSVAQKLLSSEDFSALYWGSEKTPYNTYHTESYDSITNSCSFSKKYELNDGEDSFLKSKTLTFEFLSDGVINVTLRGEFTGKWNSINNIISAAKSDEAGSFAECSAAFASYSNSNLAGSSSLFATPVSKSFNTADGRGYCSYDVTYTNDVFFSKNYIDGALSGTSYWECARNISFDEFGSATITETGTIVGPDIINLYEKQKQANQFWKNSVKPSIKTRLLSFYSNASLSCSTADIYLESYSVKKSNKSGVVSYSYSYTDARERIDGDAYGFKSLSYKCRKNVDPIVLSENYIVPNLNEIKQVASRNLNHQGYSFSISIVGDKSTALSSYLAAAQSLFASAGCRLPFLESTSYEVSPLENSFSCEIASFDAFPV
jgi:hypothetical protein